MTLSQKTKTKNKKVIAYFALFQIDRTDLQSHYRLGVGEMAPQLRQQATLDEDPSSVPDTHNRWGQMPSPPQIPAPVCIYPYIGMGACRQVKRKLNLQMKKNSFQPGTELGIITGVCHHTWDTSVIILSSRSPQLPREFKDNVRVVGLAQPHTWI